MAKYASSAATAKNLTTSFGATVTFKRSVAGTFNPVTQTETGGTTLSFSMSAIGLAPGRSAEYRIGSIVNRNLQELHCAPNLGAVPEPGDVATWAGKDWRVIWASVLDPAGDGSPYVLVYVER